LLKKDSLVTEVNGKSITITNPNKLLWSSPPVTKLDFIKLLIGLSPYMLPHLKNRLLTTIRYPDGIDGKSFYQKNIPDHAPEWIESYVWENTQYILCNNTETLVWLGTQACLELHTSFHLAQDDRPTELVIDLDPMGNDFSKVIELAIEIHELLHGLGIRVFPKTSGATGLQLYIPIQKKYSFEETRKLNEFWATYFASKLPHLVTIERLVKERGSLIYFDYLQHWRGKTLTAPYSTRARPGCPVSTPLTWNELKRGIHPSQFHIHNILGRLEALGDLFYPLVDEQHEQSLDDILQFVDRSIRTT
jgi:bifunctional non-homologous end joining protein LigD